MAAKRSFDSILEQVQASNLNFQLQVSPFSATIIKDKFGNLLLPPCPMFSKHEDSKFQDTLLGLEKENYSFKQELQISKNSSQEIIKILEQKITKIEASALKVFEERNIEVSDLKKSLKSIPGSFCRQFQ